LQLLVQNKNRFLGQRLPLAGVAHEIGDGLRGTRGNHYS